MHYIDHQSCFATVYHLGLYGKAISFEVMISNICIDSGKPRAIIVIHLIEKITITGFSLVTDSQSINVLEVIIIIGNGKHDGDVLLFVVSLQVIDEDTNSATCCVMSFNEHSTSSCTRPDFWRQACRNASPVEMQPGHRKNGNISDFNRQFYAEIILTEWCI